MVFKLECTTCIAEGEKKPNTSNKKKPRTTKNNTTRLIWTQNGGREGKKAHFLSLKIRVKQL